MDYQKQIVEFLSKPENLPVALEVSKHLETVRQNLHKAFWVEMTKALQNHMVNSKYVDRWEVAFDGSFEGSYTNCTIFKKNIPNSFKGSNLSVSLAQKTKQEKYQLIYGLCWNKAHKVFPKSSALIEVLQISTDADVPVDAKSEWWPAHNDLDIYLTGDDFALQFGLDQESYIKDLSDNIWSYFEIIEPELFKFNKEMMKA